MAQSDPALEAPIGSIGAAWIHISASDFDPSLNPNHTPDCSNHTPDSDRNPHPGITPTAGSLSPAYAQSSGIKCLGEEGKVKVEEAGAIAR